MGMQSTLVHTALVELATGEIVCVAGSEEALIETAKKQLNLTDTGLLEQSEKYEVFEITPQAIVHWLLNPAPNYTISNNIISVEQTNDFPFERLPRLAEKCRNVSSESKNC